MKSDLDLPLLGKAKNIAELELLAKEAGLASFAGGVLDKVAPQTTQNYLRPMWQGVKTQWNSGDRGFDSMLSSPLKGLEANRFNKTGLGDRLSGLGVKLNKDIHGNPDYENLIDFSGTIDSLKRNIGSWGSSLLDSANKIPFIGNLTNSFFNRATQPTKPFYLGPGPSAYNKFGS